MHTEGLLAPETPAEARQRYDDLASTADVVVREVARAMDLDGAAYDRRVTDDVVLTAQNAVFASLLAVHVGTHEEFDAFCDDHDGEVVQTGSEHVEGVVWHAPGFAETIVATTFQDAEEAAIGTLRRQAFGRLYRDVLETDESGGNEPDTAGRGDDQGAS
ncbi:hypothetical protein HLRTI_000370 [Halorhabdus tiamatea SARL4B]|uniref:Uncharacterized protein n=1 Tax=Halorhabdus tiamatea SARL4B TaxID=1033806 RepID=F7PK83_9EURY|nr:DUF5809 family protein [Halorhabdus tiamatea]ERJ07617.1 hypothetical protein HLRTI_000370 [Halorhabdus tiamatea SARL4B]CCQ33432.1 conserved hypothetical protein [Halorhabdus tiamatea SARL4B]